MAKPPYPGLVIVPLSDQEILKRRLTRLALFIIAATSCALAITDWLPLSRNKPNCQTAQDQTVASDLREECNQSGLAGTEAQLDQSESIDIEAAREVADPDNRANRSSDRTITAASHPHPDARLAQQGDAFAQYRLGRFLAQRGEPHAQESANWYRRASDGLRRLAEAGNGEAMYVLGVMNAFGRGVARDEEQARRWLTQAIERQVEAARPVLTSLEKHRDAGSKAAEPRDTKPTDARQTDVKLRDAEPKYAEPSLQASVQVQRVRHDN